MTTQRDRFQLNFAPGTFAFYDVRCFCSMFSPNGIECYHWCGHMFWVWGLLLGKSIVHPQDTPILPLDSDVVDNVHSHCLSVGTNRNWTHSAMLWWLCGILTVHAGSANPVVQHRTTTALLCHHTAQPSHWPASEWIFYVRIDCVHDGTNVDGTHSAILWCGCKVAGQQGLGLASCGEVLRSYDLSFRLYFAIWFHPMHKKGHDLGRGTLQNSFMCEQGRV